MSDPAQSLLQHRRSVIGTSLREGDWTDSLVNIHVGRQEVKDTYENHFHKYYGDVSRVSSSIRPFASLPRRRWKFGIAAVVGAIRRGGLQQRITTDARIE